VTVPLGLSPLAVAVVDLAFPVALALAIGREIVAGRNWRNLKVLGLLRAADRGQCALSLGRGAGGYAAGDWGARLGLAVVILMIAVIGGRIVPSFTRNWLARQGPGPLPAPADRYDNVAMMLTVMALLFWVVSRSSPSPASCA
jgi:uncharacterized protein involved in response to NO